MTRTAYPLDVIRSRSSTRSYDGKPLGPEQAEAIRASFEESLPCPFGNRPRFVLAGAEALSGSGEAKREAGQKIGTYGLIKKAPAFVLGAVARGEFALEDFGYAMEGIVLRIAELGLGSCWLGGIFDRGASRRALDLQADEILPSILALGSPAERMSLAERLTRRLAKAGTRLEHSKLFFDGSFDRPLDMAGLGAWTEVLEALRLGPSASNKQPWRILRTGDSKNQRFHLYLEEDRAYNNALGEIHIQNIDMGIAMRHLEAAAFGRGLSGAWGREPRDPAAGGESRRYIATWTCG